VARFRTGVQDYALGSHPLWQLFRTAYQITRKPRVVGGLVLGSGYVWAWIRRVERPISRELMAFRRREQMRRLAAFIRGRVRATGRVIPQVASSASSR
jgi:poly-beta-1,6-N-acetyl-D-glucosamine synthase